MPPIIISLILLAVFITACISGIFGMAGGLIMMGVLASFLGVSEAMIVHGAVQSVSNSSRAYLLRQHVRWDIFAKIAIGSLPAIAILAFISFLPSKSLLFIVLGALPILLWLPKRIIYLDAARPLHAVFCGFCATGLNLIAGAAGPALDIFFIKTKMPREEIVATKAVTMFASHMMKILYFGIPLLKSQGVSSLPPWWFFCAIIPLAIGGTYAGTRLLKRMSDISFSTYTKWLVSFVGIIYVLRGINLLGLI